MKNKKMPKYRRVLEIYKFLQKKPVSMFSIKEIRKHLKKQTKVSLRNVQRDCKDLSEANMYVYNDTPDGEAHYYYEN